MTLFRSCPAMILAGPVWLGVALGAASAGAAELVPHAATYRLTISGGVGGQQISGAGTATIRAEKQCQGFTLLTLMKMTIGTGDQRITLDMRIAMAETADGRKYSSRGDVAAGPAKESVQVNATLGPDGAGTATVTKGGGQQQVALPKGTVFPISHSIAVMKAALAGQSRHSALVFDPEASGEVMQVVTEIAPSAVPPGLPVPKTLQTDKAYKLSFRYFRQADTSAQALPSASIITFGNGVGLLFQGAAAGVRIAGKLTKVEALAPATCE